VRRPGGEPLGRPGIAPRGSGCRGRAAPTASSRHLGVPRGAPGTPPRGRHRLLL